MLYIFDITYIQAIYYNSEISMRGILWKDDISVAECVGKNTLSTDDDHTERASVKSFNESILLDDVSLSEKQLTFISSSKYKLKMVKGTKDKLQYCTVIISIQVGW